MNGRRTTVIDDRHVVTTTVERHRVTLEFDRTEFAVIVAGLARLSGDELEDANQRAAARDLLWRVIDDASGPSRTIDRRGAS